MSRGCPSGRWRCREGAPGDGERPEGAPRDVPVRRRCREGAPRDGERPQGAPQDTGHVPKVPLATQADRLTVPLGTIHQQALSHLRPPDFSSTRRLAGLRVRPFSDPQPHVRRRNPRRVSPRTACRPVIHNPHLYPQPYPHSPVTVGALPYAGFRGAGGRPPHDRPHPQPRLDPSSTGLSLPVPRRNVPASSGAGGLRPPVQRYGNAPTVTRSYPQLRRLSTGLLGITRWRHPGKVAARGLILGQAVVMGLVEDPFGWWRTAGNYDRGSGRHG